MPSYLFPERKVTALITGGSRGLGLNLRKKLESLDVNVVAPERNALDLTNPDSISEYFGKAPTFDILVNNAGINFIRDISALNEAELKTMFQVNFHAPVQITQHCLPGMKLNGWGRIVNVGSIFGIYSRAGRAQYTATKSALIGFTKTLAIEYSRFGILSNVICPGYVETDLTRQNNSPEQIAEIAKSLPIGRLAQPEEISETAAFLCSERNTYISGQSILIDGGFSIQ